MRNMKTHNLGGNKLRSQGLHFSIASRIPRGLHSGALFLTNRRRVTLLLVSRTRTALPSMTTRSLAAERHRDTSKKYYCRGGRSQNLLRKLVWRLKPLRSRTLALQKHFDPTSFSRPSSGPRRGPACTREPSPTSTLDEKSDFSRPLASARGLEKSDFSLSVDVREGSRVHAGPLRGPGSKLSEDVESKSFLSSTS